MEASFLMEAQMNYSCQGLIAAVTSLLVCTLLWLGVPPNAAAETEEWQQPRLSEKQLQKDRVKAAVVLNIAKFVQWPVAVVQMRENHLTLCYFREDVLGQAYDTIHDRRVGGRELQRRLVNDGDEMASCDLLVLSEQGVEQLAEAALISPATPLLVIADFTHRKTSERVVGRPYPGVHVALVRRGSKIGFEINLSAAHEAGLKVSSRLLRLARIVGDEV